MNIVVFGPPGIGKGTASELLSRNLKIPKISTGDILREEMQKDTPLARQVRSIVNAGNLVSDELVIEIFEQRIAAPDCKGGFITDGFPRTLAQAEALDRIARIDFVFNLEASKKSLLARITGRRYCPACGSQYNVNIELFKPDPDEKCPRCGTKLKARDDQKPGVVEQRLKVYETQTKPIIEYYKKAGKLHDIDAEGTPQHIVDAILSIVRRR